MSKHSDTTPARTAELVWQGKPYQLEYRFSLIRRIRDAGVNVPELFHVISTDGVQAGYRADEIVTVVAFLLRDAGAPVTDEDVWRHAIDNSTFKAACMGLFLWLCSVHFYQSPNLPEKKTTEPQAQ